MAGYNARLMRGVAGLLADNGVGSFTESGTYAPGVTAIFIGLTPNSPDRAVTLMTYPVDDSDLTVVTTGLQMRIRGDRNPTTAEDISDAIYDVLHNRQHYVVNGLHVELSWRQSGAWLGQDDNQRVMRVENFYFHAERSAPNHLP